MQLQGQYSSVGERSNNASGEIFFFGIFRKNTSKYAKRMIEPYICDSLNQIYRFFFIFNKQIFKFQNVLENCLKDNRLIYFVHLWLYFAGTKIVYSFLKLSLHGVCIPKGGATILFFKKIFIHLFIFFIIHPLYGRKFGMATSY